MIDIEKGLRDKIREMEEEYKKKLEESMKFYVDQMKRLEGVEKEFPHPIIKEMKQDMEKSINRIKESMKERFVSLMVQNLD